MSKPKKKEILNETFRPFQRETDLCYDHGYNQACNDWEKFIAKELPTPKEVVEMMCRHIDGLDHLSFKETDEFAEAIIKDIKHKLGVE